MQRCKLPASWAFQALADETRLRVVRLLVATGQGASPGALSATIGVPPSHLSRHLQVLESACLVVIKQNGRGRIVRAAEDRGINAPLYAALLAAEDASGVLAADLRRFLEATERESREASG